jgi:ATP-dependent exoDNAse (exonuclease V) beta subunit
MSKKNLTLSQQAAVSAKNTAVIINANAGTGKTAVLIERIIHLLTEEKLGLENILAITFTEKAAGELKDRLRTELQKRNIATTTLENSYISTIHGFCSRVLREQCFEAGLNPSFSILSNSTEQEVMIEEMAAEVLNNWLKQDDPRVMPLLEAIQIKELCSETGDILDKLRSAGLFPKDISNLQLSTEYNLELKKTLEKLKPEFFANFLPNLLTLLQYQDFLPENLAEFAAELRFIEQSGYSTENFERLANWFASKPRRPNNRKGKEIDLFLEDFKVLKKEFEELQELLRPDKEKEKKYQELYSIVIDFIQAVYLRYTAKKQAARQVDFEALLLLTKKLFLENKTVREFYKNKFKQIMLDEFQDTDQLQLDIFELISSEKNLFIVGDWKQSIYRFRNANVELFLGLLKKFRAQGEKTIVLQENFRSGKPILDLTNFAADLIWPATRYDYQDLIFAADQTPQPLRNSSVTITFLKDKPEEPTNKEQKRVREARLIAGQIKDLKKEGYQFGEMALLLRATSDLAIYEDTLRSFDIPLIVFGGRYYYQRQEVIDLINYLKILNNPFQDLTLAGVLRSPLVGIRDESLLILCQAREKKNLFTLLTRDSLERSALSPKDKQKLLSFKKLYDFLAENIGKLSLSALLTELLEKSGYLNYLLSLPEAAQKKANIYKLLDIARTLAENSAYPLSRFVRYLEKMQLREAREEEAATTEQDAVKIMTVHKSKGLEFPIVFLPDINRESGRKESGLFSFDFNLYHRYQLPLGLNYQDTAGEKQESHLHRLHSYLNKQGELEEAKRLLYVALTRAKTKLFISVIWESTENKNIYNSSGNWGKWICALYTEHSHELERLAEIKILAEQLNPAPFRAKEKTAVSLLELKEIYQGLALRQKETLCYSKLSATEIADLRNGKNYFLEKNYFEFPARSLQQGTFNKETSEKIGNRAHQLIAGGEIGYAEQIEKYTDLSLPQKKYLGTCLENYFNSGFYQNLKTCSEIYFELPFNFKEQTLSIDGRIDLICFNGKSWQIVDFKTNQQTNENLKEYHAQLSVYALALAKVLKIKIAEIRLTLYYLHENQLVELQPLENIVTDSLKELA